MAVGSTPVHSLQRAAGPEELRIPVGNEGEMIHLGTDSRGRRR